MKNRRIIMNSILSIFLAMTMFAGAGCASNKKPADVVDKNETTQVDKSEAAQVDKSGAIQIKIVLEDGSEMKGELYPNVAPKSVENFVNLIEQDFFDGTIFHRCIEGFMIQGGGFEKSFYEGNFESKETESIVGEFTDNGFKNDLKHTRGVLSMARTSQPNSASSQFFIMHQDSPHLDGQYAAFGEITEGLDIVDKIATGATTALEGKITFDGEEYVQQMTDVPQEPVVIKTIDIIE